MIRGFLAGLALFASAPLAAQQAPKIGLVLGGGGARGFAHVGVLQVLEENRIPVHAVAGTSMGAVVGSLYASGKNADQLTQITQEIPWSTIFDDTIPRERLPFRRKRDQRDVLVDYRISFDNNGLVLPKGVLRGQDLFLTLAEYLAPARGVTDFDRLAIPFRAVATDIENGSAVVLGTGDIATAVFASMSVPGGLPPVEREGKLLVDGFVADNVPVDVTRSMGVDKLIVVDVGTPLRSRDQITSFVAVLDQMQLLLGRETTKRQLDSLGPADVLIQPDLDGVSTTGFDQAELGIARGRAAAEALLPALRRYSLSEADWQAYLAARATRAPRSAPTLDFVKIVNNSSETPDRKIREMVSATPGKPLDARRMTSDLQDVYALGGFRAVRYGIGPSELNAGEGVTIVTDGDPTSANWLQLGLGLSTDFNLNSTLKLGLAYTNRNWLGTGAELRTDVRVGSNILFETGLYREFGRYFAEVTPFWSRVDTVLYVDNQAIATVRDSRVGARLDGGMLFGNWGELRLGVNWSSLELDATIGAPLVQRITGQDMVLRASFTADKLDSITFPTRGLFSRIAYTRHMSWLGGDLDYGVIDGRILKPVSWGRNTLLFGADFGFTSEGNGQSLGDFRLGGFLNLSGLDPEQLVGRHKLLGRVIFYHRTSEVAPIVNLPVYIGGSFELGNAWASLDEIGFDALRPAGSLFIAADTPIGPLAFAGGIARGGGAVYLILGRIF